MIIYKVQYTVLESFAIENKRNVDKFVNHLKQLRRSDLTYAAYVLEDGKTFVHLSHYKSEEAQRAFLNLDLFKTFQEERDKHIEVPAKVEKMEMVGASFDFFIAAV